MWSVVPYRLRGLKSGVDKFPHKTTLGLAAGLADRQTDHRLEGEKVGGHSPSQTTLHRPGVVVVASFTEFSAGSRATCSCNFFVIQSLGHKENEQLFVLFFIRGL
jgi:hypothetical protein